MTAAAPQTIAAGLATPVFDAQAAFRAALEATSRPGRAVDVPVAPEAPDVLPPAMAALALTVLDGDTTVWLDPPLAASDVPAFLRFHCGCVLVEEPHAAAFALIAAPQAMPPLGAFSVGRDQFPEESATLLIETTEPPADAGPVVLRGPGIRDRISVTVGGLPTAFWAQWAANAALFPQGVDVLLTRGRTVMGLPRSTMAVEV